MQTYYTLESIINQLDESHLSKYGISLLADGTLQGISVHDLPFTIEEDEDTWCEEILGRYDLDTRFDLDGLTPSNYARCS